MEGMTERDYSAHSGLSCGAIQKARKAGRLVVYGDGSINAAASDARRSEMTDPDQQRRSTGGDSGFSGPADRSSYLKSRTALQLYQMQERQLAIQKKPGKRTSRGRIGPLMAESTEPGRRIMAASSQNCFTSAVNTAVKGRKSTFRHFRVGWNQARSLRATAAPDRGNTSLTEARQLSAS